MTDTVSKVTWVPVVIISLLIIHILFLYMENKPAIEARTVHTGLIEEIFETDNLIIENYSDGDGLSSYVVDNQGSTYLITMSDTEEDTYDMVEYQGKSAKEYQEIRRSNRNRTQPIFVPFFK